EPLGEICAHRNGMPIGLVVEHIDHLADDFVYVNHLQARSTLSVKRADTLDDVGCTGSVPGHFRSRLARLRHIGLLAIKKSQACLSVCYRRSNWLIDFVG